MSRVGDYSLVYVGELVGIALMFTGFRLVGSARSERCLRQSPRRGHEPPEVA